MRPLRESGPPNAQALPAARRFRRAPCPNVNSCTRSRYMRQSRWLEHWGLLMRDPRRVLVHNRREFLGIGGGLAVAGFLAPEVLAARPSPARPCGRPARSCILVYLLGGPPHLDMFDLKPSAPAEIRGPFRPIATTLPGVQICEHLPRLARMTDRYALVRSVSHNNHNHTPMIYYTLTGRQVERPNEDNDVRPPQRGDAPHIGAVLACFKPVPAGLPGLIAIPELSVRSSLEGEFKRTR